MRGLGKKNLKTEEVDKMNIAENSKQYEFLMKIRDVGMAIIFRKANSLMVLESFAGFDEYFENQEKLHEYIQSLQKISVEIDENNCSPDDLLLELGQYTPYIIYDDEEDEEQTVLYDESDSWLYH